MRYAPPAPPCSATSSNKRQKRHAGLRPVPRRGGIIPPAPPCFRLPASPVRRNGEVWIPSSPACCPLPGPFSMTGRTPSARNPDFSKLLCARFGKTLLIARTRQHLSKNKGPAAPVPYFINCLRKTLSPAAYSPPLPMVPHLPCTLNESCRRGTPVRRNQRGRKIVPTCRGIIFPARPGRVAACLSCLSGTRAKACGNLRKRLV